MTKDIVLLQVGGEGSPLPTFIFLLIIGVLTYLFIKFKPFKNINGQRKFQFGLILSLLGIILLFISIGLVIILTSDNSGNQEEGNKLLVKTSVFGIIFLLSGGLLSIFNYKNK